MFSVYLSTIFRMRLVSSKLGEVGEVTSEVIDPSFPRKRESIFYWEQEIGSQKSERHDKMICGAKKNAGAGLASARNRGITLIYR